MKKSLALLLALCLSLCSAAAIAESDLPAIEIPITFEGSYLAIADTGISIALPDTWVVAATVPENAIAMFADSEADPSTFLVIALFEKSILDIEAELADVVNSTGTGALFYVTYNSANLLIYASADESLTDAAFLPLNNGTTLCLSFTATSEEVYNDTEISNIICQILGSLTPIQE